MQSLNTIFEQDQFDPAMYDGEFKIAVPPMMSDCFIFPLMVQLQELAPKATLIHTNIDQNPLPQLASGEIDFAIFTTESNENIDKAYNFTPIRVLHPCIFSRRDHPLFKLPTLTLADCLSYPFVDLNLENKQQDNFSNPADVFLQGFGVKRNVLLKSSQLSVLTSVVKKSDYLLLAANFTINGSVHSEELVVAFDFKDDYKENVILNCIEHQRIKQSAAHQWFKGLLIDCFAVK